MLDDPRREGGRDPKTTGGSKREDTQTARNGPVTEGTDRDFDEAEESKNQGHGHPRGDREPSKSR